MQAFDIKKIRRDFPILSARANAQPLIYLDNAATSQKPRAVIDKLNQFYKLQNANVHRGSHYLSNLATDSFEQARSSVATFLNAYCEKEIIWCKGTTEAINLVANSLGSLVLKPGDVILVSSSEHHANIVPWQLISELYKTLVIAIPLTDELQIDLDAYSQLLEQHQPKIVALGHVSNATGVINPIKQLVAQAKQQGAITLVDGAQAVAHLKIDVRELDCDFYCFSGHKCLGPTGTGVLWGRQALLEEMPPWQGGGEMIKSVSFSNTQFNGLPFKFEAGTPAIADNIALAQAITYLNQLDRAGASAHEQQLLQALHTGCQAIEGVNVLSPLTDNAGIVSLTIDDIHHQDAALLLDQSGIAVRSGHHCAMPLMQSLGIDGTLRASICFYNTLDEINTFVRSLQEVISVLRFKSRPNAQQVTPTDQQLLTPFIDLQSLPLSADIVNQLTSSQTWQQRFSYLMTLADYLPQPSTTLLSEQYKLQQCESGIWLDKSYLGERVNYRAWSDARIMRGLIVMLISCKELVEQDLTQFLHKVKLSQFLSPSRTNGVKEIFALL